MAIGSFKPSSSANTPTIGQVKLVWTNYIWIEPEDGIVYGTIFNDIVIGTHHNDIVATLGGDDQLYLGGGRDHAYMGDGDDYVLAGAGNDHLNGENGNDRIEAGTGNDFIDGGSGNDRLTGGLDADTFWFDVGDGQDVITDYEAGVDRIWLFGELGSDPGASFVNTSLGILISYGAEGDTLLLEGANVLNLGDFNVDFV